MTDLTKEISNSQLARDVLENPLYIESYQVLEADILQMWVSTATNDSEKRETLWLELKILHRLKDSLRITMDTGKLAQRQYDELNGIVKSK